MAVAFANQKLEEEDKRYRAKVGRLPPLPRRSDDAWVIRPGETKTVLLARLAINRNYSGTGNGLVKFFYVRDTRRSSAGLGG